MSYTVFPSELTHTNPRKPDIVNDPLSLWARLGEDGPELIRGFQCQAFRFDVVKIGILIGSEVDSRDLNIFSGYDRRVDVRELVMIETLDLGMLDSGSVRVGLHQLGHMGLGHVGRSRIEHVVC